MVPTPLSTHRPLPPQERAYVDRLLAAITAVEQAQHQRQVFGWRPEDLCPSCGNPTEHLDLPSEPQAPVPHPCECELDPEQSEQLLAFVASPDLGILHACGVHRGLVQRYVEWATVTSAPGRSPEWVKGHVDALWGAVRSVAFLYLEELHASAP